MPYAVVLFGQLHSAQVIVGSRFFWDFSVNVVQATIARILL